MEFEDIVKSLDDERLEYQLRNAWSIIKIQDREKLLKAWEFTPNLTMWFNFVIRYATKIIEAARGESSVWLLGADNFQTRFSDLMIK